MHNILLIPDSFKGTLSSRQVCETMARAIGNRLPRATVRVIPVADGGEGTVEAFLTALGGEKVEATVCGPLFAPVCLWQAARKIPSAPPPTVWVS